MNLLINALIRLGLLREDLDYHLMRASMVVLFLFFGYQKWFDYEAQVLIPYISNGPLLFWMYPVFGIRGASWVLGVSEWSFALLLFLGFWHNDWEFSARSDPVRHSSEPSPSSRSCRTAGPHLPAAFPP
jgi:uncharacterized membrane protein YkgB